jgi:hypothetical protein
VTVPRLLVFWAMGSVALLVQLPLTTAVQALASVSYLYATAVVLAALVVLRFVVLNRVLYAGRSNRLPLSAAVPETDGVGTEARHADDGSPGTALALSEVKAGVPAAREFPGRDRHSDHGELI